MVQKKNALTVTSFKQYSIRFFVRNSIFSWAGKQNYIKENLTPYSKFDSV